VTPDPQQDALDRPSTPPLTRRGRFASMGLALGLVALVSISLMTWSHLGWNRLQTGSHSAQEQIDRLEVQMLEARALMPVPASVPGAPSPRRRMAPLDDAMATLTQLSADEHAIGWISDIHRKQLQDLTQALQARLSAARQSLGASLNTGQGAVPLAAVDQQLAAATSSLDQLRGALQTWTTDARERQRRIDVFNMALIGLMSIGVIVLLGLAYRQRGSAMRALKAREAELRAFADALPDLAFLMDHNGRYIEIFGNNSPLLGRPREQLIGRHASEFFTPEASAVFMSVLQRAIDTRQTQALSYPIRVMGGQRHFDSRCAPVGDSNRVVWLIWDVTARRRAEQRLIHMTRLYDFLSHVNQSIVRSSTEDELLGRVCDTAIRHGRFKSAWVSYWDIDGQSLTCRGRAGDGLGRDEAAADDVFSFDVSQHRGSSSPIELALQDGLSFHCADLAQVGSPLPWVRAALDAGLQGCAILPLRCQSTVVGFLFLLDRQLNPQDQDEKALLEDVSQDLSFALGNLHKDTLREQIEERIRLHAAALESSRDGMVVFNRDRELVSINPAFTGITGYAEEDVLGRTPEFLFPDDPLNTINDIGHHLRQHGSWEGEAWAQRKNGELFTTKMSISAVRNTQGLPSHFVAVLTDITQLKQTEARLARMAHYDPLTELPNRTMIHERLAHATNLARRHQTLVGVVFIDLDNFKMVNDSLGHAAGDTLLKLVAQRLRQRVRQEDTLGRLGGDEFILVLEHLRHPQQAAHVAQAVIETLSDPFDLGNNQHVYVRASIGVSLFPNDCEDAGELIRNADAAMYQAKRLGRNNFRFYTESMTSQAADRLQLETRLRRAVEHREFTLHYQPMVRVSDRRVVAVEALVRLRVPDTTDECLPSIGPDEFIPVMEDTGMIMALGEWVLQEACRQGRAWLDAGLDFGRLAVNVSAAEIRRGGVIERVSRVLRATGLPADRLELEITESGLMEHGDMAERFLQQLHQLGVALSIDDFGTGYSSLAYLKRFPVHQLKIDRSFVQDLPGNANDAQLVSTMISLAHNLNMRVVAEGVEMPDQEAFLGARGCDVAQGYLFSRPVAAAQIEKMLPRAEVGSKAVASV